MGHQSRTPYVYVHTTYEHVCEATRTLMLWDGVCGGCFVTGKSNICTWYEYALEPGDSDRRGMCSHDRAHRYSKQYPLVWTVGRTSDFVPHRVRIDL